MKAIGCHYSIMECVPATGIHTLDRMTAAAPDVPGVRGRDVHVGDVVIVRTKNSVYSLVATGEGRFRVTGGWFAAHGPGTSSVRVLGCTWGRCAILTGMVAAPCMFVEFDNGVRTTRVREVRLIRHGTATVH